MNEQNDLLDAVDALTKNQVEHFPQKADDGSWLKAHTVTLPPLLLRLAQSVTSSTGSGGRQSGSSPWAASMLDSESLYQFGQIKQAIGDWCRMVSVIPTREGDPDMRALTDLRQWYIAHTARTDTQDEWYIRELRRWAHLITSKLDPPRRFELEYPCPICGQSKYTDAEGNELKFPVVVEYRDYGTAESIRPKALCRACEAVWRGEPSIRELGDEMTQKAAQAGAQGLEAS